MAKGMKKQSAFRFTAYKAIKGRIINLDLKPGEKILEADIASTLNVSRTPVREALLMLENEKLVECRGSTGFTVRKFSAREVEEYFAVRRVIEEFVMSLVLERITEDELEAVRENVRQAETWLAAKDIPNVVRCESEFHELLYKAAKSEVLFETISTLTDKFQWLRAIALSAMGGVQHNPLNNTRRSLPRLKEGTAGQLGRSCVPTFQMRKRNWPEFTDCFFRRSRCHSRKRISPYWRILGSIFNQ